MSGNYDDILHLPHPAPKTHRRMSQQDRAAQFAPFAALVGYEDVITEAGRLTDRRIELDDGEIAILDERLRLVLAGGADPEVSVTWFQPDERKNGGSYVTTIGKVKKVDELKRTLVMKDGAEVPIEEIIDIQSPVFRDML